MEDNIDIYQIFDRFAAPVRWKVKRNNGKNGFKSYYWGSGWGIFFSMIAFVLWFGYLGSLIKQMVTHQRDQFNREQSANDFDVFNEMKMNEYNFLPSIEMRLLKNTPENWEAIDNNPDIDLFDNNLMDVNPVNEFPNISISKLDKYMTFYMNVRTKKIASNENFIHRVPMRKCTIQDFTKRGLKLGTGAE